ncbi:MAG: hypothetical protein WC451_03110 [Patescibacteria group bacterium]|jgi:hypothetical protein
MKKIGVGIFIICLVLVFTAGCFMDQFWPSDQISPVAVKYIGKDPKDFKLPISTLGNLKNLKAEADKVHLDTQVELQAKLAVDSNTYSMAHAELKVKIEEAEKSAAQAVNIGWMLASAIAGGGGMLTHLKKVMYSEEELNAKLLEQKAKISGNAVT